MRKRSPTNAVKRSENKDTAVVITDPEKETATGTSSKSPTATSK